MMLTHSCAFFVLTKFLLFFFKDVQKDDYVIVKLIYDKNTKKEHAKFFIGQISFKGADSLNF